MTKIRQRNVEMTIEKNICQAFIWSTRGYIGLASPDVQPRDKIALLEGGAVPFIVRIKEDEIAKDHMKVESIGRGFCAWHYERE
jgi:hypothetical protein